MVGAFDAVIFPAGPAEASALAEIHVCSWRETYAGLLPDAFLNRLSVERQAARWRAQLGRQGAGEVVLALEEVHGLVGYCGAGWAQRFSI